MRLPSPSNIAFRLVLGVCCSGLALTLSTSSAAGQTSYVPVSYYLGNAPSITGLQTYSGGDLTLNLSSPVLTLDYGTEVAGFPFVQVSSVSGPPSQIELKYSEPFDGLNVAYSDGPWYLKWISKFFVFISLTAIIIQGVC